PRNRQASWTLRPGMPPGCRVKQGLRRKRNIFLSFFRWLPWRAGVRLPWGAGIGRLAIKELADQVFQHHGRLRGRNGIAWREVLVVGARFDPDVLLPKQSAGKDFQRTVLRERITSFQREGDARLEGLVVEADRFDAAHHDAGALHGRLALEPSDVVELGYNVVARLQAQRQQVGRLQSQEKNGSRTDQHEQAYPYVALGTFHRGLSV